jgi:endonuclease/exonuclease/phosphatase family metal-dependent hydrolase
MRSDRRLRLLSYNIQSGLTTKRYSEYFTRGWKHVLPVPSRMVNLAAIASLIAPYDVVGLQEVDAGSLRSGFLDQAHYLADRARFPHFYEQTNRRVGRISRHSNVVLSRVRPEEIQDFKLPGVIKGRGALMVRFGDETQGPVLDVYVVHLALSNRARATQLAYLAERIRKQAHVILMGDLNCTSGGATMRSFRDAAGLSEPVPGLRTFPSWKPTRQLDHILVSRNIPVHSVKVLPQRYSDHLPIEIQLEIPADVQMTQPHDEAQALSAQHWQHGDGG